MKQGYYFQVAERVKMAFSMVIFCFLLSFSGIQAQELLGFIPDTVRIMPANPMMVNATGDTVTEPDRIDSLRISMQNIPDTLRPWQEIRQGEFIDKKNFGRGKSIMATEISVDKTKYTIEELVTDVLVTGCLQAYNIEYDGDEEDGIGFFSGNGSLFPLDSGLIIASGKVTHMVGPNSSGSYSTNIDDAGSDSDLTLLNGTSISIYDEQILEFDFIPAGDIVEFRFVFASDEYEEYFCSSYNDKFGFILSGPGISGPYSNGGENIAKLADGTIVSINTVGPENCGGVNNSGFYSEIYQGTEFDGSTIVLTATAAVQACETYHIRILINDKGDSQYDSGVFLEANSFSSNDVAITAYGNGVLTATELYEGCANNSLIVSRAGADDSQELVVDVSYSPAGMNGTDIVRMDGTPLPDQIILPPGVQSDTLFYYAVDDGITEPIESEEFTLTFFTGCPCDPSPSSISLDLQIYDAIGLDIPDILASNVECAGQANGVIVVNPSGGSGSYEYQLDAGGWQPSNTFSGLEQGTYTVSVRDANYQLNCQPPVVVTGIQIQEPEPIVADAGQDKTVCFGQTLTLNGSGGAQFEWSPSDWLSATNVASPVVTPTGVTNSPITKTYTLTVRDADGSCPDTDEVVVTVNPTPAVNITADGNSVNTYNVCPDDVTTLAATISANTITSSSVYSWSTGETTAAIDVSPNSSQSYDVTVENEYGCSDNDGISIQVLPIYVTVDAVTDVNCAEDADAGATVNVSGPAGIYPVTVAVSGDQGYSGNLTFNEAGQQLLSDLGVGNYTVTGTSTTIGCDASDSFSIDAVDDIPPQLQFNKAGDTLVIVVVASGPTAYVSVPQPVVTDNCSASFDNDYTGTTNASGDYPVGETIVTYTATDSNGNQVTLTQKVEVYTDATFSIVCPPDITLGYNPQEDEFTEDMSQVQTSANGGFVLLSVTSILNPATGGPCDFQRTRTYTATWKKKLETWSQTCDRTYSYSVDTENPSITCSADITINLSSYTPEYNYYKEITLSEQSGIDLTDYQLRIDVDYVSGKMNSDYSDLKFVDSDNATTLDFWVETYDATRAVCWVEIPSISASSSKTLYLYYGNASATSLSNGTNTFIFFDDFSTWSGWVQYSSGGVQHRTDKFLGINTLQKINECDPHGGYKLLGETVTDFRMIVREQRASDESNSGCGLDRFGLEDSQFDGYSVTRRANQSGSQNFGVERRNNGSGAGTVQSSNHNQEMDVWYRIELTRDDATNTISALLFDDTRSMIGGAETGTDNTTTSFDRFVVHGGHDFFFDFMAVGRYVLNEPSIAFGAEQEVSFNDCELDLSITDPVASDNCELISLIGVRSDGLDISDPYGTGTTTITWTATDGAGNTNDCIQTITVNDDIDPEITCPSDISSTITNGQTSMIVSTGTATGADNCTDVNDLVISGSRSDGLLVADPFPLGTTTITWTVEDESGNSVECLQIVELDSDRAPGGVSDGLALWFKSNEGAYNGQIPSQDNGVVSLWDDYVRNYDAKQAGASVQPIFSIAADNQNNFNPGLIFDGDDDYMVSDLPTNGLESSNTVFIVLTPGSDGAFVGLGSDSYIGIENNTVVYSIDASTATQSAADTWAYGKTKILSAIKSGNAGNEISIYINGNETEYLLTGNGAISAAANTRIGVDVAGASGKYFNGNLAEVIIYNKNLSEDQRSRVETYLAVKYGITLGDM